MKNSLKKCFALLLAMVMVFAMATVVFAEEFTELTATPTPTEAPVSSGTYKIAIDNANGNTYKAYKVASFGISDAKYVNLEVQRPFAPELTKAELEDTVSGYPDNGADIQAFAKRLAAKTNNSTAGFDMAADSTIAVDGTGYYLIVETAHSATDVNIQSRYILVVVDKAEVHVATKTSAPTVEKKIVLENSANNVSKEADGTLVDSNVVAIGDTVTYQLKANMPVYSDDVITDTILFMLTDTMSAGLTYGKIISVQVEGQNVGYKFVGSEPVNQSGATFKIAIDPKAVKANGGKDVVVTFTAVLNGNAQVGADGNPNSVQLTYSNKWDTNGNAGFEYDGPTPTPGPDGTTPTPTPTPGPDAPKPSIPENKVPEEGIKETPEDTVITYTGVLQVKKIKAGTGTEETPEVTLPGAKFKITTVNDKDAAGLGFTKDATTGVYTHGGTETELVTDANGLIKVVGLDAGTYYAVETEAPTGYTKDETPQVITLTVTGGTNLVLETEGDRVAAGGNSVAFNNYKVTWTGNDKAEVVITNKQGITLPGTGGIGTTLFTLGGLAMVILACVMFISYARKQKKQA